MPAGLDEQEVVRRVLAGDREAFRLVVLRHQRVLIELVYRQTGDRAGSEDMVQETFLRAYEALDRFDPRYRLSTWLSRIALNVARDHGRRRGVRDASQEQVAALQRDVVREPAPEHAAARAEAKESVTQALLALPPAQRELVVLSVYGGLSHREIAALQDVPLGTVKSRLRAAFGKLRDLVAPLEPGGAA